MPGKRPVVENAIKKSTSKRPQARSIATKQLLIDKARQLFVSKGYYATGTNDLVAMTPVSRGALYHHFGGKEELFVAVYREVAAELYRSSTSAVSAYSGDTWKQLTLAIRVELESIVASEEVRRILLVDGPSVLGWKRWREMQSEGTLQGLIETIEMLINEGVVASQPREPLAQLILAGMNDAALSIAYSSTPKKTQEALTEALMLLLSGIRSR